MKRVHLLIFFVISFATGIHANGLEFRLTLSGKVLLGIAYRYQIDTNTALRLGSYLGLSGAPVGMHLGMIQDTAPQNQWTPFFEVGADMLFFKRHGAIGRKIYPSGSMGVAYCPAPGLKHSAELRIGWLAHDIRPIGLSYVHFNAVD